MQQLVNQSYTEIWYEDQCKKTKMMCISDDKKKKVKICIDGQMLEHVNTSYI